MREIVLNLNSTDKALYNDTLIRQGENKASKLKIILTEDFIGYNYNLLFQVNDEIPITSDVLTVIDGVIEYEILNSITNKDGQLKIELNAFDDYGILIKSATTVLKIIKSLDGNSSEIMPEDYVPWYVQAVNQAIIAEEQALIATEQATIASDKVEDVILLNDELNSNIQTSANLNDMLIETITNSTDAKLLLDESIVEGNQNKNNLDDSISLSITRKGELDGTISLSVTRKNELDDKIIEGNVLKSEIEDAIADNQIVTQPEFTAHKEDYASLFTTNADAKNSIYRGKYLGNTVTPEQYTAISSGTFTDLYIGDYWTIGGLNWRIAAFNYYRNTGDTLVPGNHITIVPDTQLYTHVMNDTNITTGGYTGSKMYTEGLEQAKTTIRGIFGTHLVKHRQIHSNATVGGKASGWVWVDSEVDLMSEIMVYGSVVWGESTIGGSGYNIGVGKSQLPLFRLNPRMINTRQAYWLKDVVSTSSFAYVDASGTALCTGAGRAFGVRPAFSIS